MVKKVSLTVATLDPCLLNIDAEPTEVAEGPATASLDIFPLKILTKNKRFFFVYRYFSWQNAFFHMECPIEVLTKFMLIHSE